MVSGMKFANLGPFQVARELVTFQCLCACLCGCERGETARASAGSFKFAPAVFGERLRLRFRLNKLSRVFALP
jgi:hypothetical protein